MIFQRMRVIESFSASELTRVVNDFLVEGWKLSGGIAAVYTVDHRSIFYQAIYQEYNRHTA